VRDDACMAIWNKRERDEVLRLFANQSCSVLVAKMMWLGRGIDVAARCG